jgi:hypothetical protein
MSENRLLRDAVLMIDEPVEEVSFVLDLGIRVCLVSCQQVYE